MLISLIFFLVLLALQVADSLTTWQILALGGHEGNLLLALAMQKIGIVPALALVKTVLMIPLAVIVWRSGDSSPVQLVLVGSALLYVWVVSHNKAVLSRLGG